MPSPSDPPVGPGDRPSPPAGSTEATLRRLEERLDRASEAAERLMAQAAAAAAGAVNPESAGDPDPGEGAGDPGAGDPGAGDPGAGNNGERVNPPPAGWQVPEDAAAGIIPDLDPLLGLVQALRDLIPPDLQRRLVAALRELLLALRALIDWYIERLERRRDQSVEVQDIPIL